MRSSETVATVFVARSLFAALSAECPFVVLCGPHVTEYDQAALEELARSAALEGLDLVCFGLEPSVVSDPELPGAFDSEPPVAPNSELSDAPVLSRVSFARRYHGVFTGSTLFSTMQANHDIIPDTSNMLISTDVLRSLEPSEGLDLGDVVTRIALAFRLAQASSAARCVAQKLGRAHVPNSLGMLGSLQDVTAMQAAEALSRLVAGFQLMMGEARADGTLTDPHFRKALMGCWAEIIDDATKALPDHSLLDEAFVQLVGEGVAELAGEEALEVAGISEIVREESLEALWLADLLSRMVAESRFDRNLRQQEWRARAAETRAGELESSTSYQVGRLVTAIPRKLKDSKNRRAHSTSGPTSEFGTLRGDDGRKIRLIAALTSFPPRIDTVSVAIRSMMSQTMPFDSIELNLARSQFPRLEDDLPAELLELREHGLVIGWCDRDTGPYKRYTHTMQKNPDAAVVMLDDDLLCEPDMLETLYRAHLDHPTSVIGVRTHRVVFGPDGAPLGYQHWSHEENSCVGVERMDLYATPGAGTLFPPRCLPEEAFDEDLFMELAPNGDDMWLKFMELIAGTPVVLARPYGGIRLIDGTQEATSLWSSNRLTSGNDVTMARLFERFDLYHGPNDTLHSRLRRDID